jgi:PAS domain S-box-containing protein
MSEDSSLTSTAPPQAPKKATGDTTSLARTLMLFALQHPVSCVGLTSAFAAFIVLIWWHSGLYLFLTIGALLIGLCAGLLIAGTQLKDFQERALVPISKLAFALGCPLDSDRVLQSFERLDTKQLEAFCTSAQSSLSEQISWLERYQLLMNNLAASVVIRDSHGQIVYCNPFTEVLTGYSLQEIGAASEQDFFLRNIHSDDKPRFERAIKIAAAGEAFQFRYRFMHRSGIEMWAETRTVPILAADGSVQSSLSVTLDVTGLLRYQRQVEERNRDLQDFSYMLTHDLKAPIATLKGMLGVIEDDCRAELSPKAREPLMHMQQAIQRLEQLVNTLLEYSKVSAAEFTLLPVSLTKALEEALQLAQPALDIVQATIQQDPLPDVLADSVRLSQVFSNLVDNSIKYRSPERELQIEVHDRSSPQARMVCIEYRDNGRGVPSAAVPQLFRPFQRAHAHLGIAGTGVGLASVKRILEKMGGSIRCESKENLGTSFFVELPRATV